MVKCIESKPCRETVYRYFNGVQLDGTDTWTTDASIAVPVWSFPLMTSVQQVMSVLSVLAACMR